MVVIYRETETEKAKRDMPSIYLIALNPEFALAYAYVGWTHFIEARYGWSTNPVESIRMGFEYGQKAVALDETLDYGHMVLASIYLAKRQFEKAIATFKKALKIDPNHLVAHIFLAACYSSLDRQVYQISSI